MKRFRLGLFPASASGCTVTDLRVVVICAGAIVLSAVSGWLIGRFGLVLNPNLVVVFTR